MRIYLKYLRSEALHDFCIENYFTIFDQGYLPADAYTYVSSPWGTTSWLDHVICTADVLACISSMEVLYNCIHSDNHPLLFRLDCDIAPECDTSAEAGNATELKIHWDNLHPCDVHEYEKCTNIELNKLVVLRGIRCNDPNCKKHSHHVEISQLYNTIIYTLSRCSQPLVSNHNRNFKQAIVPGWNAHVKEQHDYARDAYWLWREMGKPRNGDIFTLMKLSRSRLKYALRKCNREQEVIVSDSIANKMCPSRAISGNKFDAL